MFEIQPRNERKWGMEVFKEKSAIINYRKLKQKTNLEIYKNKKENKRTRILLFPNFIKGMKLGIGIYSKKVRT